MIRWHPASTNYMGLPLPPSRSTLVIGVAQVWRCAVGGGDWHNPLGLRTSGTSVRGIKRGRRQGGNKVHACVTNKRGVGGGQGDGVAVEGGCAYSRAAAGQSASVQKTGQRARARVQVAGQRAVPTGGAAAPRNKIAAWAGRTRHSCARARTHACTRWRAAAAAKLGWCSAALRRGRRRRVGRHGRPRTRAVREP